MGIEWGERCGELFEVWRDVMKSKIWEAGAVGEMIPRIKGDLEEKAGMTAEGMGFS